MLVKLPGVSRPQAQPPVQLLTHWLYSCKQTKHSLGLPQSEVQAYSASSHTSQQETAQQAVCTPSQTVQRPSPLVVQLLFPMHEMTDPSAHSI
jgi:hypothetical protein